MCLSERRVEGADLDVPLSRASWLGALGTDVADAMDRFDAAIAWAEGMNALIPA